MHENCIAGWLVFVQWRDEDGYWTPPVTTGDVFTARSQAVRNVDALQSRGQDAWLKEVTVHRHI
jgi:hypothetical protein